MTTPERDGVLRPGEVADLMAVQTRTVRRWAYEGRLPFFRTLGGQMRFREPEVKAAMEHANP